MVTRYPSSCHLLFTSPLSDFILSVSSASHLLHHQHFTAALPSDSRHAAVPNHLLIIANREPIFPRRWSPCGSGTGTSSSPTGPETRSLSSRQDSRAGRRKPVCLRSAAAIESHRLGLLVQSIVSSVHIPTDYCHHSDWPPKYTQMLSDSWCTWGCC